MTYCDIIVYWITKFRLYAISTLQIMQNCNQRPNTHLSGTNFIIQDSTNAISNKKWQILFKLITQEYIERQFSQCKKKKKQELFSLHSRKTRYLVALMMNYKLWLKLPVLAATHDPLCMQYDE